MSNQPILEENKKEVYLNNNDVEAVLKYFSFFKLPMAGEFSTMLETFKAQPTYENQKKLELMILGNFLESKGNNEQLDKILEPLYDLVKDAHYKLSFHDEFAKALDTATEQAK